MIRNYLKVAWRNIWKHKVFTGIVVFGLSVAIAASLVLLLTAFYQFSFDGFHANGDRLYQVYSETYESSGTNRVEVMPAPFAEVIGDETSDLEHITRWAGGGASVDHEGEVLDLSLCFVDTGFLQMFSFPMVSGSPETALEAPNTAVLSEKMAKKLFGDADPLGQVLRLNTREGPMDLTVSGVISDFPPNSSLRYDVLTRFENHPEFETNRDRWDNIWLEVFVQLKPGVAPADLAGAFKKVVQKYQQDEIEQLKRDGAVPDAEGEVMRYQVQPFTNIHFDNPVDRDGVSKAFLYGLMIIAGFILGIACINFVNLSLGGALRRTTEVGVRKVLGASRRQVVFQFWTEALLLIGVSLVLGLALVQWLLPEYNAMFRMSLRLDHPHLLLALGAILLFISLAGGGYPALVLSRFQPSEVLRGTTTFQRPGRLRNVLVLLQFIFSVLLITCTFIVGQQLHFLRTKPMGFNKDQVISIPLGSEVDARQTLERLRNDLAARPEVVAISAAYRNLGRGRDGSVVNSKIGFTQDERNVATNWVPVEYDYLETMEIPLVAGRSFQRDRPTDTATAIVINETFARELGFDDPVGQTLQTEPPLEIIGVMKDFHFQSLSRPIEALSFVLDQRWPLFYIVVRVNSADLTGTMQLIENSWKRINPRSPFLGSYLDENVDRLYEFEALMGRIFTSAAVLAVLLSCMGLFGISLLVIAQRTKEIGIRKVLGASVQQIVLLVSSGFLRLVGLAILLASPLAWWAMRSWLDNYAYRIDIQWWVFALAGAVALIIAFLTLSWQSVRAALSNPVEALRDE